MRIVIRGADIFQADTEPISSCLLNNRVIIFPAGQGLLCNRVWSTRCQKRRPNIALLCRTKYFKSVSITVSFGQTVVTKLSKRWSTSSSVLLMDRPEEMLLSMIRTILSCPFHVFPMNYVSAVIYGAPCTALFCCLSLKACMDFSQGANWEKQNCSI